MSSQFLGSFAVIIGHNHSWDQTQSSREDYGITLWAATSDGKIHVGILTQWYGIND